MKASKLILFLSLLGTSLSSLAAEVGTSITSSASSTSQTLSGALDGEFKNIDWGWEAYLDHTQSQWSATDSDTGTATTGTSRTSTLGSSFSTSRLTLSPAIVISEDQKNKVSGSEINFGASWKHIFESNEEKEDEKQFSPWLRPSLKIGRKTFKIATAGRRGTSEFSFLQNWTQYGLTVKALKWMSVSLRQKIFTYSKNPEEVLTKLETQASSKGQSSSSSTQGFSDTVSSLLKRSTSLATSFYFLQDWETSIYRTWSMNNADDSTSVDTNLSLYWSPTEHWTIGIQGGQSTSSLSTETSTYSGASLNYEF